LFLYFHVHAETRAENEDDDDVFENYDYQERLQKMKGTSTTREDMTIHKN